MRASVHAACTTATLSPAFGMTFSPPCRGHPSARGMSYDDKVRKLAAPFDEALAHTRSGEVA